jgi:hypothetical protein
MKIRKDVHGLYVIVNGGVYRPQPSRWGYGSYPDFKTTLTAGESVKGHSISQSPHAAVAEEIWSWHGPSPELQKVEGKPVGSELSWASLEKLAP